MTAMVSTAACAASISAAMTVAAHAGVTVAAIGVSVAATNVAVASPGVAIAIEAVATAGVAVAVKAPTVATPIEAIVGEAAIEVPSAAGEAVSTAAIVAVVPRAGTDKGTADKVVGSVEAIRRASVGVIVIVTVGANGSYADVARAHSNPNRNLSLGVTCRKHEKGK